VRARDTSLPSERDDACVLAGSSEPQRLGREELRHGFAASARLGFEQDEFQRELAGHTARVVIPASVDPRGHPLSEGDDAKLHR
jgi:hypothetical protein